MYFNPGESGLTFYWIDFTQFLLNLTIERAPYLAWKAVFLVAGSDMLDPQANLDLCAFVSWK